MKKSNNITKKTSSSTIFHSRKFWLFGILSVAAYVAMFSSLFGSFLALQSMIYMLLLFLFFHFFYLEIKNFPINYLIVGMLGISILEGALIGYSNILLVGSALAINTWIVYLAWLLQWESHDKIIWSTLGYLNVWGYLFTVCITIGYSLFILGYYAKFPFTCQDLSDTSNRVIQLFTKPVANGVEKVTTDTSAIFTTKVKDIASIGSDISLQTQTSNYSKVIQNINSYKANFIDQALKDNKTVNMGICDYVLWEINKIYNNPAFKVSVILLMFLLLYGFIRIEFWVMTGIAFIVFKIMFWSKAYRIRKVMKEVEELE